MEEDVTFLGTCIINADKIDTVNKIIMPKAICPKETTNSNHPPRAKEIAITIWPDTSIKLFALINCSGVTNDGIMAKRAGRCITSSIDNTRSIT